MLVAVIALVMMISYYVRWPSGLECWLELATGRSRPGSNPTSANRTLAIPFTQLCQCLSEEKQKAVGPFYLVSMPGEVKDPTSPHWNTLVTVVDSTTL